jgi:hypothetical protein
MKKSYGSMPQQMPEGMGWKVHWPSLGTMDKMTSDGRFLESAGGGVRELPRTVYAQHVNTFGHEQAMVAGRMDVVELDDETGNIEAWGWLLDDEVGNTTARYIASQALRHNSMDLNDCKVTWALDDTDDLEVVMIFNEWNVGATTILGKPAFADSTVELVNDEVMASFRDGTLTIECPLTITFLEVCDVDVTASLATADPTMVAWADFHQPEPDHPQKITIDPDGRIAGHLALWDSIHDGYLIPRKPPRPRDNYASFNQAGPLTELGHVETGPIFFAGGHPKQPLGGRDPFEAYGSVENCWGDVRVIEGRFGPWLSGRVRPGVSDEVLYAARASRISGHWVGDALRAIVSVNVPAFNVPGSGLADTGTTFGADGELLEMVASFPPERQPVERQVTLDGTQGGTLYFSAPVTINGFTMTQGVGGVLSVPAAYVAGALAAEANTETETAEADEDIDVMIAQIELELADDD